jgi:hypothetical protein
MPLFKFDYWRLILVKAIEATAEPGSKVLDIDLGSAREMVSLDRSVDRRAGDE